jgi:hypothetical protein
MVDKQSRQRAKDLQRKRNNESGITLPGPKWRSANKSANEGTTDAD